MDRWIAAMKNKVHGKMVMIGKAAVIPMNFNPPQKRRPDDPVGAVRGRGGRGRRRTRPPPQCRTPDRAPGRTDAVDAMLLANGALVRINDAARGQGIIVAQQNHAYDPAKTIPTVIVRNDDYGRIERLLADKDDVKLEFNIVKQLFPEGKTSYNVVGEIPGRIRPTKSSCWAGTWIPGTPPPAQPITASALPSCWKPRG